MKNAESSRSRRHRQQALRRFVVGVVAVIAFFASSMLDTATAAGNHRNPGIIPPDAHYGGLTYGEWQARMQQWTVSIPLPDNPIFDGNEDKIALNQPKQLWFLSNAGPVTDRHFTIPAGTALYANIFSVEWDNQLCTVPDTTLTVPQLRQVAAAVVDTFTDIAMEVDGVSVRDVAAYRSTTPVFYVTLPDDNILQPLPFCPDALPGTYGPAIADGYGVILAPLSVGEHVIHTTALVVPDPSDPSSDFPVDITWRITVTAQGK